MDMFKLNSVLEENLIAIGELSICLVFLTPDSHNPWIVLVPQRPDITEWHYLSMDDQVLLLQDINHISKILKNDFSADKINIGSLGNMVSQMHVHIIARYKSDSAWPGSVWGRPAGNDKEIIQAWKTQLIAAL